MNSGSKKTIHWFSWHPTPYNDIFFRALSQSTDIALTVHYYAIVFGSHPWKVPLCSGYAFRCYQPFLGIDWRSLRLAFSRKKNMLYVVAGWNDRTTILLLSLLRVLGKRFIIWTDTPNLALQRPYWKGLMRRSWLNWIFCGAYRLFATGDVGVAALRKMGAPESRLVSFPFWCDLESLDPKRKTKTIEDSPLSFVSSGRLVNAVKGHDLALRALAVAMRGCEKKWIYRIAGTGSDHVALQKLAQELGIGPNVIFLGWMDPDTLVQIYLQSDIMIHPSPTHDPFPNAIIEGMAAGLVVMGSDVCGSALDRIESGKNGFIHTAGDWNMLASQIGEIVSQSGRIKAMGTLARDTAELWPVERGVSIMSVSFH